MKDKTVKVSLEKGTELPKYGSNLASGVDLRAMTVEKIYERFEEIDEQKFKVIKSKFESDEGAIFIGPQERILFGTGISIESLPPSSEIQVRPRSGNSLKKGYTVANSPGTVDEDYRGNLGVIISNPYSYRIRIEQGERIAQAVVVPILRMDWEEGEGEDTERGENGFGSTGNI